MWPVKPKPKLKVETAFTQADHQVYNITSSYAIRHLYDVIASRPEYPVGVGTAC